MPLAGDSTRECAARDRMRPFYLINPKENYGQNNDIN
jgi:hypothetical protein